ncbi:hypothetical protein PR202_ga21079 [Eleusine coracana subsp. coracana]|uniref:F-box domain-containing protein n=1 Tax=Eleusine coracana subsp. coracana TaxID=191504 RepID=A0AAV5D040_ELECO|nr:hypothetical protein PR202_ga21079 [Eleusine coracana subsp. coracana]
MDDAIAEILLRLPPDEPSCLVRASLVCKSWCRLLSDPAFLRRYRVFHRAPPLLGFLRNLYDGCPLFRFVPTAAASPFATPALDGRDRWAVECRHGRALLNIFALRGLIVWDPVTGDQHPVPAPVHPHYHYTAAVLCGVDGVVFAGSFVDEENEEVITWASEYTSETGAFSEPSTIQLSCYIETRPSVLSGDALYFSLDQGKRILKYDLVGRSLSVIDAPQVYKQPEGIVVTSEDGRLGLVGVKDDSMYLWSWQVGSDGVSGWVQNKVIKLKTLLPILDVLDSFNVIGFAESTNTILMSTDVGVFTIVLKSGQVRKVGEQGSYYAVAPYTSFYTSGIDILLMFNLYTLCMFALL